MRKKIHINKLQVRKITSVDIYNCKHNKTKHNQPFTIASTTKQNKTKNDNKK